MTLYYDPTIASRFAQTTDEKGKKKLENMNLSVIKSGGYVKKKTTVIQIFSTVFKHMGLLCTHRRSPINWRIAEFGLTGHASQ